MARGIDSDYIDLSLMGGFDMGIDFDGFEENAKKFIELPIKYLDSAHDKAVELIEHVHAMLSATFPGDVVPNEPHGAWKDPSNSNVITGSSPKSVETKLIEPNAEVSTRTQSHITVESCSTACVDTHAHETESFVTKSSENTSSSNGSHTEANDLCFLPEDTSTTEISDSYISEEVISWNPEISVKPPRQPEPTTIYQDDYIPQELNTDKLTVQDGHHCSGHSDMLPESSVFYGGIPMENSSGNYEEQTILYSANIPVEATKHEPISHDLSMDVSRCADDTNMRPDKMIKFDDMGPDKMINFDDMDLKDDQEKMENHKIEACYVHQRKNASFKKMFMRSMSNKLRWSKKQTSAHRALPGGSLDAENLGYQAVSSSDDLDDDDWEVVM